MTAYVIAGLVLIAVAVMYALRGWRRVQANRAAQRLGGSLATPSPAPPYGGGIGAPDPAVPAAVAPAHRTGILTSGPPVELTVCGLPALAWQRSEWGAYSSQPMQLHLIADAAVGLPFLQLSARSAVSAPLAAAHGPTGVAAIDEHFAAAGDVAAWAPVLAVPAVQQALLAFPLERLSVTGGRLTFVSKSGVHLDPGATSALAQVAAAVIGAIPPQITSAGVTPPPTALVGAATGDADTVVRNVLARSGLSPEQQSAMLQLMRASEHRPNER